ncbi:nucleotide exchange factor GrpE [Bacillus methanolicus]|uniref:nucleotide exchange factor GrpE n=1 Tax=Bacillus methanolicus TaxID=1471 RepID=UPI0023808DA1|nr:nucleotide exchange factor GrpE [Bacillus methanolicus]MDE3839669.1 nucleotide exchange factor GrpE [Bacillus methanolicus]
MTEEKNIAEEKTKQTTDHHDPAEESLTEETIEPVFAENEAEEALDESKENELEAANAKIAELEAKLEEASNRYLRLQADFENFRRRSRMDLEASQKYRAQSLVTDLLPVIDNFERGLKLEVDNEQAKSLLQGMEMVYRSLLDALKKEGVEPIEAVGKEFDPNLHHAVMQVEDENYDSNIVVEEFQKGYMLKDRVIRPSMVKVNQ